MTGYVIRRLLLVIPVVWGALTILFILFFIVPGDPVELMAGASGRAVPDATRQAIEQQFGLDDPIIVQYGNFWKRTLTGDLGTSYASRRPVADILKETFPNSLRLAIWAIVIETVVGISVGVLSAIRRYSLADNVTTVITALAASIPVFVLGFIFQQVFGVFPNEQGWPEWARLPVQGTPEHWNFFLFPSDWQYLILPMIVLASVGTALVARMTRTTMLEVSRADYMRTARAKGVKERQVVLRHGLRNALIPVVTLIGLDLANLIGAAIITETVFNWRGMGRQIATSIFRRDAPVVLGLTLVLVVAYVLINLLVDLSYGFFDPRVRIGKEKS
ncbi:MAG TPA: ABC transporter permease [Acidimicrobiales bacterium]|nr:ABC transporter permease [Acidimicrobiales bacterium]